MPDGCAQHIPRPTRRMDKRYVPLDMSTVDPRYAKMPFRRTAKVRNTSLSPKRRRSESPSPATDSQQDDIKNIHIPPTMELSLEDAGQAIETFRHNCLIHADRCAISGKGQSWCITPSVGPGIQASHIIPQQHFYLYPHHDQQEIIPAAVSDPSPERLRQAWNDAWSNKNGILLMSHIRHLFEARLISIHPDTHKIRAFVPYDVITDFNGKTASLPRKVDKLALKHHYEMSCIENMAAQMPAASLDASNRTEMGFLEIRSPLGRTISLPINNSISTESGDPAKRARLDEDTSQWSTQDEEIQRALSVEYELTDDSN